MRLMFFNSLPLLTIDSVDMRVNPVYMQFWEIYEYHLKWQCDVSINGRTGSSAQDSKKSKYWAYVLGYFVWHHTLAVFQLDMRRCRELGQILFSATESLHLPEYKEWQDMPLDISGRVIFPMMQRLIQVLESKYSEPIIWTAGSGYLTGLVLASLMGQVESEDLNEVSDNLITIQDMLVPTIYAVEQSRYSEQLRQVLQDIQIQFGMYSNRELAIQCKCMLEPVIRRLLLGQGELCYFYR